jgi:multiple sugar transport system permease protein
MSASAVPASVVTATTDAHAEARAIGRRRKRQRHYVAYTVLSVFSVLWLLPIVWTFYISLRPYAETQSPEGLMGWPKTLNFQNYINAFQQSDMVRFFINSVIITVPAVLITLFLASLIAFAVSRYSFRFNIVLLLVFTAGNLLPPQIILVPLYRMYLLLPLPGFLNAKGIWYDSYWGVAAIHIAFQMGFATFVLSNFMKALPTELTEAALVDGASVWTQYRKIILPLCRPALAALGVLMTTWIYNDFLWALVLMSTGSKRPITAALNNLKGQFFTDLNLLAAGAMIAAIPTLIVFFVLQKQFVGGLTLGATKG